MSDEAAKVCRGCGAAKARDAFYGAKQNRDGLMGRCIACTKTRHREYRETEQGRARIYAAVAKWQEKNPAKMNEAAARWKAGHPEWVLTRRRRQRRELADEYVRQLLHLPFASIPDELVTAKRAYIHLKRAMKERQK